MVTFSSSSKKHSVIVTDREGFFESDSKTLVSVASLGLAARELVRSTGSAVIYPDNGVIFQTACSYCNLSFKEGDICRSTICMHAFHARCMEHYFSRHKRCPICRFKLGSRNSSPTVSLRASPTIYTPCWSPDYDSELMRISNAADQRFRDMFLFKRGKTLPPRSTLFIGGGTILPIVKEEDEHPKSFPRWVVDSSSDISLWTAEMKRVAIAFVISLARMHVSQSNCLRKMLIYWESRNSKMKHFNI